MWKHPLLTFDYQKALLQTYDVSKRSQNKHGRNNTISAVTQVHNPWCKFPVYQLPNEYDKLIFEQGLRIRFYLCFQNRQKISAMDNFVDYCHVCVACWPYQLHHLLPISALPSPCGNINYAICMSRASKYNIITADNLLLTVMFLDIIVHSADRHAW